MGAHRAELQNFMKFANATASDFVGGRFDRLIRTGNDICWQYTSRDELTIYLLYFHILAAPNLPFRRVRLIGLDPMENYKLEADGTEYAGDDLIQNGMPLPYVATGQVNSEVRYMEKGDFSSYCFVFKKVTA